MTSSKVTGTRLLTVVFLVVTMEAASLATGVSAASAAPPPGVSMQGTGPQPAGLGLFSTAALAQAHCSKNGRMWFATEGTGPYCVNPWPEGKSNGGSTAPGVTAKEVKVVVYYANSAAATTFPQLVNDTQAAYQYASDTFHTYQLWGRKPVYEFVKESGTDETAQRADAVKVIAMKPFLVMDISDPSTGAPVFAATVANHKILVASSSTTPENGAQQSPYRWNYGGDQTATLPLTAAFVGRSLSGRKAAFAGDALTSKKRVFGAVYPQDLVDLAAFQKQLKDNGGTPLAKAVAYDPTDPTKTAELVPNLVVQLKAAGVTSVIVFADPATFAPMLNAADQQQYSPEWIITGYGYTDFDTFARAFDPKQMKHAFGIGSLTPYSEPGPGGVTARSLAAFNWYWGDQTTKTDDGGFVNGFVYNALHYAGPTLTAANVKKGLFAAPVSTNGTAGISAGYGNAAGLPYPEYALFGSDSAMIWWNPTQTGPGNAVGFPGTGKFMYLSGGARFGYTDFPKSEPKFFDPKASAALVPLASTFPGDVIPPKTPCVDCPSSGGSG